MAAVSTRRMIGPRVIGRQPWVFAKASSAGVKSPSGPTIIKTLEGRSRTTAENAAFTKALVNPKLGERWLLVTSAAHMPRAVGCFRRVGFPVEAYPVDWRTPKSGVEPFSHSFADNLALTASYRYVHFFDHGEDIAHIVKMGIRYTF